MIGSADLAKSIPELDVHGCSIAEIRDGRIAAARLYADSAVLDDIISREP